MSKEFRLGVLVSGRGTNLQAIIDWIEKETPNVKIALVISNKENAHALERCRRYGIQSVHLDPKSFENKIAFDKAMVTRLKESSIDLVCLAGFMRILSSEFIHAFPKKIINVHPSLLPAFPGLDAQKQALEYGVKLAGCTVHFVDEGVDTGPIICQTSVPVFDDDTEETLSDRILTEEHKLYPKAIQSIMNDQIVICGRKTTS
jgi:phosphoribosylglycinamide formyltransferase 1